MYKAIIVKQDNIFERIEKGEIEHKNDQHNTTNEAE